MPIVTATSTWLGIDIGGSKVALALGDATGEILARRRRVVEPGDGPGTVVAGIAEDAAGMLSETGLRRVDLTGVGIAAPGPLDADRGLLLAPPNLPDWKDVPIRDLVAAALELPVRLDNDANAAALAEWRFGAGRGFSHLAFLTMSTGVGAGLVLDGRLYHGQRSGAGEIGHAPIEWEGEPCACGQRGCLEAYVGGSAWTGRLRERAREGGRVATLAGGPRRVTPEHLIAAAREGDVFALEEMERFNHYLARGIAGLVFLLAPEVVVLGTIAAAAGEELCLEPVRRAVRARVWPSAAVEISAAVLGSELPYRAGLCVATEAGG